MKHSPYPCGTARCTGEQRSACQLCRSLPAGGNTLLSVAPSSTPQCSSKGCAGATAVTSPFKRPFGWHTCCFAPHMLMGPQVTSPQPHCRQRDREGMQQTDPAQQRPGVCGTMPGCVCPSCPSCDEVHPGTAWVPPLVSARQPSPQPPCPISALNSHHQQPVQLQMGCSCAKYQKACFLCSSGRPTAMLPGTTTGVQATSTGLYSTSPVCGSAQLLRNAVGHNVTQPVIPCR